MELGTFTGIVVLCTAVPVALVAMGLAHRNRSLPGVRPFFAIVLLALWWSIGYSCESLSVGLEDKLTWWNLQFVSITLLPVAFLVMALRYTGRDRWVTWLRVSILCLIPAVTNILVLAGSDLMRASAWLDTSGTTAVVGRTWGPWFWVHAGYSYLLLLVTLSILVAAMMARPRLRNKRLTAVFIGTLLPVAGSLIETIVPSSSPSDDLTPGIFIVAVLVLAWGLLRVRIFDLLPIARHALVENMRDGVIVLDTDYRVVDINESAYRLIGKPRAAMLGRSLSACWEAWEDVLPSGASSEGPTQLSLEVEREERHYEARLSALVQHGQTVAHMLVLSDTTDRVLLEQSLRDQALADGLTGLPNRTLLMARLEHAICQSRRRGSTLFALMVLDLDHFKSINDTLGHVAGDVMLRSVATKLRRCVREADTVARIGGDEFIILLHDISSQRDLLPILTRIRSELRAPVYFGRQEMVAGSSIGVVIWDQTYDDPEEMVRAADTAMYQAKRDGRDCYRFFDEEMHEAVLRSAKEEADMRASMKEHAFSVVYQPVVDMATAEVHSLEALLRWHHPERGTLFPREFLTVAESSGLIFPLGEIALDEIFSHVSHWSVKDQRFSRLPVRVNVSPRQLSEPDFVSSVLSRLAAWHVPSSRLILEMTEDALVRYPLRSAQAVKRLQGLGVRLCLDDFGSGRSSLHPLTALPLHELKIDPSHIVGAASEAKEIELLRHISALAHTLGLAVVAEGVEDDVQWDTAKEVGCDLAQGHYIAGPMEFDMVLEMLKDLPGQGVKTKARNAT